MTSNLEDRLLITNRSKGKGGMFLGGTTMVLSGVYVMGSFVNYLLNTTMATQDFDTLKKNVIAGGVCFAIGYGIKLIGKVKNWWYN